MLVLNTALPAFRPKIMVAMSGRGLRLAKMQTRRTWSLSVIGLSIETVRGTEFPLSARGGTESVMRPVCGLASPKNSRMAGTVSASLAWERTGLSAIKTRPEPSPVTAVRRVNR
jgi:hypothetical protein